MQIIRGGLLFNTKDFVSFVTYCQSMYFMSNRFLKDKINGFRVQQFQLSYIYDTTHPSHKNLVKLFCEVHYMRWLNQYMELQEQEDCIKSNKT